KVEFTNINCTSWDPEFSNFEYCYLKSVNRSYKYMSLKVNLYKVPINVIKVNIAALKRLNGYKPFLYNATVDACRFLKNPKSNPVFSYLHNMFRSFSNMNHTCPYNVRLWLTLVFDFILIFFFLFRQHDLVVEKLNTNFLNNHITSALPVPEGDYALQTSWFANNILRATVLVSITL
ncbi:hypothetical protein KR059_009254, partial [Drosophila kikkawai]